MRRRYVMGTFLSVQITGENSGELEGIFLTEVQRFENLLSRFRPESEISRINRAAGGEAIGVSADTYEAVEKSLHYARLSEGAFDPVAVAVDVAPADGRPGPISSTTIRLDGSRPTACRDDGRDYRQVHLDSITRTVFLSAPGMQLDLGGIGKGFALDKALDRVLAAGNPKSVSADFGGQLLFWHAAGFPGPETIVIEDPESRGAARTFQINSNGSVSTSSNAERSGHLIDPRSGQPARGTAGVSVLAPTATEAEALSTALFVLGAQEGQTLLETQTNVQVFFV